MKKLRLRPGIIIVVLQWLLWMLLPLVFPGTLIRTVGVLGGMAGGLALMIWWAFFSRAPRWDRWGGLILWILALIVSFSLTHESITTGMMGIMFFAFSLPIISLAFILWAVVTKELPVKSRRISMLLIILISCGIWPLLRSDGLTGDSGIDLAWRWSQTHEEKLLNQTLTGQNSGTMQSGAATLPDWPGFRGSERNNVVHGIRIETDWSASAPEELWRQDIGPGCSSFAVSRGLAYTQEQRGENEVVSCYSLETGEAVWKHTDKARFWDSHAGAGPRSTPTIFEGNVYTLGATGILNVLKAENGTLLWSRNAAEDTEVEISEWGYASSPLVVDGVVIVAISGTVAAYDILSGKPLWFGPDGGESWSSPHLLTIDGVEQVLMMSGNGPISFRATDGTVLWEYDWPGAQIVQPAMCENGDLILSAGDARGMRRLTVSQASGDWTLQERWSSLRLKPNFNDYVVHEGHVYGFIGPSLACLDLEDGQRKWKAGRYGGQILLLADQDLLILLTEKGELALVEALPEKHTERARIPVIESKTWNHPVLVGNLLLVRNMQEMAAYKLTLAAD